LRVSAAGLPLTARAEKAAQQEQAIRQVAEAPAQPPPESEKLH
jgi:hypothetical protein